MLAINIKKSLLLLNESIINSASGLIWQWYCCSRPYHVGRAPILPRNVITATCRTGRYCIHGCRSRQVWWCCCWQWWRWSKDPCVGCFFHHCIGVDKYLIFVRARPCVWSGTCIDTKWYLQPEYDGRSMIITSCAAIMDLLSVGCCVAIVITHNITLCDIAAYTHSAVAKDDPASSKSSTHARQIASHRFWCVDCILPQ